MSAQFLRPPSPSLHSQPEPNMSQRLRVLEQEKRKLKRTTRNYKQVKKRGVTDTYWLYHQRRHNSFVLQVLIFIDNRSHICLNGRRGGRRSRRELQEIVSESETEIRHTYGLCGDDCNNFFVRFLDSGIDVDTIDDLHAIASITRPFGRLNGFR